MLSDFVALPRGGLSVARKFRLDTSNQQVADVIKLPIAEGTPWLSGHARSFKADSFGRFDRCWGATIEAIRPDAYRARRAT